MNQSDLNLAAMYYQEKNRRVDMIMKPDFRTWAENIVLLAQAHGTGTEEIERALMQSYDQGYHFGLNYGWVDQQDKGSK